MTSKSNMSSWFATCFAFPLQVFPGVNQPGPVCFSLKFSSLNLRFPRFHPIGLRDSTYRGYCITVCHSISMLSGLIIYSNRFLNLNLFGHEMRGGETPLLFHHILG